MSLYVSVCVLFFIYIFYICLHRADLEEKYRNEEAERKEYKGVRERQYGARRAGDNRHVEKEADQITFRLNLEHEKVTSTSYVMRNVGVASA